MEKKLMDLLDEEELLYFQKKLEQDFENWAGLPLQREKSEKAGIGLEEYVTKYD